MQPKNSVEAMDKQCRPTRLEVRDTKLYPTLVEFELDYEHTKHLPIGESLHSDAFSACGHMWRLKWYPGGAKVSSDQGKYMSFYLELMSKSSSVEAIFTCSLEGNGQPSSRTVKKLTGHCKFCSSTPSWGWMPFVSHDDVEAKHVKNGYIKFSFTIMVTDDSYIPLPHSDIGKHFGTLLDSMDGTDVSFIIDGQTFHAHRVVLAARSPVFKAELFGSMAEGSMSSITLHEITPSTFKLMLRFMYTDSFPSDDELGQSSPMDELQDLLVAADRYALNRLKLLCAQKLYENLSVDAVVATLACAEIHSCPELKKKCVDFIAAEENFRKVVSTDGFMRFAQQFPSIVAELRERSRMLPSSAKQKVRRRLKKIGAPGFGRRHRLATRHAVFSLRLCSRRVPRGSPATKHS